MPEISCRGEKSNWAVLTAKSVKEIREIRKSGMSYAKIAKMFNVHRGTVGHIIRGSTWAHLE
jgi:IS30 family transposase